VRVRVIVACGLLATAIGGCGLISGLDSLDIEDAGQGDATSEPSADAVADQADVNDAPSPTDGGHTDGGSTEFFCGVVPCNLHTSTCCAAPTGGTGLDTCIPSGSGACPAQTAVLHCASPADCDAGVCCLSLGFPQESACQTLPCSPGNVTLCTPTGPPCSSGMCVAFDSGLKVDLDECQ